MLENDTVVGNGKARRGYSVFWNGLWKNPARLLAQDFMGHGSWRKGCSYVEKLEGLGLGSSETSEMHRWEVLFSVYVVSSGWWIECVKETCGGWTWEGCLESELTENLWLSRESGYDTVFRQLDIYVVTVFIRSKVFRREVSLYLEMFFTSYLSICIFYIYYIYICTNA